MSEKLLNLQTRETGAFWDIYNPEFDIKHLTPSRTKSLSEAKEHMYKVIINNAYVNVDRHSKGLSISDEEFKRSLEVVDTFEKKGSIESLFRQ